MKVLRNGCRIHTRDKKITVIQSFSALDRIRGTGHFPIYVTNGTFFQGTEEREPRRVTSYISLFGHDQDWLLNTRKEMSANLSIYLLSLSKFAYWGSEDITFYLYELLDAASRNPDTTKISIIITFDQAIK